MADVHVATSLDQLGEHAEAWDRLAMASADRLPMLSHAWVSSFLEHRTIDGSSRMRWLRSGRPRRCWPPSLLSSGGGGC